jgi:hypothetical protein
MKIDPDKSGSAARVAPPNQELGKVREKRHGDIGN